MLDFIDDSFHFVGRGYVHVHPNHSTNQPPVGAGPGSDVEHDVQAERPQHGETRPLRHPIPPQTRAKGRKEVAVVCGGV